jgi:diacylglycerol kinase (ATP)
VIAHVVANRDLSEVLRALDVLGVDHRVIEPAVPTVAGTRRAIEQAVVDDGAERVIVVGGDGMVHAAVNALAPLAAQGRNVSLGVVPLGTGNDFARALGIPADDTAAAVRIAVGQATPVDLLQCDHGWVATVATCGFPARVNERANRMRWPRGSTRYTLATLLLLPRLRADRVTIAFDDAPPTSSWLTIVAIANTGWFGGGMHIAPDAVPTDGRLAMVTAGRLGRLSLLRYLPKVFTARHLTHRATAVGEGVSVSVHADGVDLWGDGEPLGPLPVTVHVVPAALSVAQPA